MREPKKPPRMLLTIIFTLTVFCILVITMIITAIAAKILVEAGVLDFTHPNKNLFEIITISFVLTSIAVGTLVSFFFSKIPLKPVNTVIEGMNKLASGDYQTRIYMGEYKAGKDLADSFNTLASELENTGMLRSDFVNNFSHEFKTPIVSILGFAQLVNKGGLSKEQEREYLEIIEEEAGRLADMATSVLELTKIENQDILTGVTKFNVSEQIRSSVLLLEKKWTQKELELNIEFGEYNIYANEDMLKRVWINLLDNAIKFSPPKGILKIEINQKDNNLFFDFTNMGKIISPETAERIFDKFYQGDVSHTMQGNGLGLTMVRKIAKLHGGEVYLKSSNEYGTVFEVRLPTEQ